MFFGFGKKNNGSDQRRNSNQGKETVAVSSDIQEVINEYIEITVSNNLSKDECIRRCDEMIIELEWKIGKYDDQSAADWKALWEAVCNHDTVYQGNRYPRDMMSNIGLKIIEQSTP